MSEGRGNVSPSLVESHVSNAMLGDLLVIVVDIAWVLLVHAHQLRLCHHHTCFPLVA